MTTLTLYGIPTCDTCKKAIKALEEAGHDVTFHDVRADPLSPSKWDALLLQFGEKLINRSSTTYRGLSDWMKASDPEEQLAQHPTLMKRPVIETEDRYYLGWDTGVQAALLK
ncbi:arsenate reductase family protein [Oceaniglobus trochenteri]|uniref:arsenate reductase family protein n=1 Tax=Oceaniglobus trochenteri TaxID=2763260 RepID=UPI001CFFAAC3|nr:ArsC/Spx/MgsR family protein [Oceaniglobus trochenteri]